MFAKSGHCWFQIYAFFYLFYIRFHLLQCCGNVICKKYGFNRRIRCSNVTNVPVFGLIAGLRRICKSVIFTERGWWAFNFTRNTCWCSFNGFIWRFVQWNFSEFLNKLLYRKWQPNLSYVPVIFPDWLKPNQIPMFVFICKTFQKNCFLETHKVKYTLSYSVKKACFKTYSAYRRKQSLTTTKLIMCDLRIKNKKEKFFQGLKSFKTPSAIWGE